MSSKVYFCDLRAREGMNLTDKLRNLMLKAGIKSIDFDKKFTCIKIHFGEPGNMAYLRPNYAKAVADLVKELGGRPFLSDANTLYAGRRKNALEHIESAYENGFNPFATGCHVIIGDGLKGTDEVCVPVEGGEYVKEAKIGRAFMDADIFISLTHFKGHDQAGFGGCIKNIGMGCGSRGGKMDMHSASKPDVEKDICIGCGACARACAHGAISFESKKAFINHDKCVGCAHCVGACPVDAVTPYFDQATSVMNYKIAEYTKAVVQNRPAFHINMVIDVSPNCDCWGMNDVPIVSDIGMFASFDPIALDRACVDAVNSAKPLSNTELSLAMEVENKQCCCGHDHDEHHKHDHFKLMHPDSNWQAGLEHGEKIGLGTQDYELIKI